MTANRSITVYGASGHTGQFVVSELHRRGWTPVPSGRDPAKLRAAVAVGHGELELRPQRTTPRPHSTTHWTARRR